MENNSGESAETLRGMLADGTPLGVCAEVVVDRTSHALPAGITHADVVFRDEQGNRVLSAVEVPVNTGTVPSRGSAKDFDAPSRTAAGRTVVPIYTAVVAMQSRMQDAERRFQSVTVSLDSVPGNQVEGISPLYHVVNVDAADGMAAVVQLTTRLDAEGLCELLDTLAGSHEESVELRLADMRDAEGASVAGGDVTKAVRSDAAVLAPWLDMDANASLGDDPVSYLLAMAPNAMQVGLLSDQWILGETR